MIQGSGKDCGGVLLDWDHALALKPGEDASSSGGRTVSHLMQTTVAIR